MVVTGPPLPDDPLMVKLSEFTTVTEAKVSCELPKGPPMMAISSPVDNPWPGDWNRIGNPWVVSTFVGMTGALSWLPKLVICVQVAWLMLERSPRNIRAVNCTLPTVLRK